jgi:hypothetical protein
MGAMLLLLCVDYPVASVDIVDPRGVRYPGTSGTPDLKLYVE